MTDPMTMCGHCAELILPGAVCLCPEAVAERVASRPAVDTSPEAVEALARAQDSIALGFLGRAASSGFLSIQQEYQEDARLCERTSATLRALLAQRERR